ncbi:MAG: hypothetical protein FJ279_11870, partial [Planctomycetes bacterium]|nr:hypothetical protein [Planctomycetota bacterium]
MRANVPVFGVADAPEFKNYRLEFGQGKDPDQWTTIKVSSVPQREDPWAAGKVKRNPNWGAQGNLGTWETGLTGYAYAQKWKHDLLGVHTIRLVVEDRKGRTAEARVVVDVSDVITNLQGGKANSEDALVTMAAPANAITSAFLLVSIRRTDEAKVGEGLVDVSGVYEWQPPGAEFMKPVTLTFKYDPKRLQVAPEPQRPITPEKLGVYALDQVTQCWQRMPSKVDETAQTVAAELRKAPMYRAFLGLFADIQAPEPPKPSEIAPLIQSRTFILRGQAEPVATVVTAVDGAEFKVVATERGEFRGPVTLRPGQNHLTLRAVDPAGNASPTVGPYVIEMAYKHPKKATGLKFLGATMPTRGDRLVIQLDGEDTSPD